MEDRGSVSFERGPPKALNMHRDCRPVRKSPLRVLAPKAWPQKEYSLSPLLAYTWKQLLAVEAVLVVANFWECPPSPQSLCASSSSQTCVNKSQHGSPATFLCYALRTLIMF